MRSLCNFDPIEIRDSHQTLNVRLKVNTNVNTNAQGTIILWNEKQRLLFPRQELRVTI